MSLTDIEGLSEIFSDEASHGLSATAAKLLLIINSVAFSI